VPAERRLLAALGPRKLEIARTRCAGAIALLVTPAYTSEARTMLGEQSTLVIDQFVVLDTDATRARETAREPLKFLSGIPGYRANFARMGFTDTDVSDLSDRLVDALVAWGDADTIAERINTHRNAGADHVILAVLNRGNQPGPLDVARQLGHRLTTAGAPTLQPEKVGARSLMSPGVVETVSTSLPGTASRSLLLPPPPRVGRLRRPPGEGTDH